MRIGWVPTVLGLALMFVTLLSSCGGTTTVSGDSGLFGNADPAHGFVVGRTRQQQVEAALGKPSLAQAVTLYADGTVGRPAQAGGPAPGPQGVYWFYSAESVDDGGTGKRQTLRTLALIFDADGVLRSVTPKEEAYSYPKPLLNKLF